MLLSDLEAFGIIITDAQKPMYQKRMNAAIKQVQKHCNRTFEENGAVVLPEDVQLAVSLMVKSMGESQNVASQSLGDMSKSFFQNGTYIAALSYLKPYRKAGFK